MKRPTPRLLAVITCLALLPTSLFAAPSLVSLAGPIVVAPDASFRETLAAKEVRRYVYLRTGKLFAIQPAPTADKSGSIVVARKDRPLATRLASDAGAQATLASLAAQSYWLKTFTGKKPLLLLTGGDDTGTLYAAYRLAEHLGVRFYMEGDVIPDQRISLKLPPLDEKAAPLFALRGIQPFHDFPEGPDWWNRDDYFAILSQLPKLRMNFFGLHTYPEGGPNAEPTVWIGPPSEIGEGGKVKFSYPSSYQNTLRGNWGYASKKTSDFVFGAAELFERDDFGAEVMWGHIPNPTTPAGCNEVFNRTAVLLRDSFEHAHRLGVRTCVGTETPLTVPKAVRDRLKAQGKDPKDLAVMQELYEGIFRRIAQAYPLDYYWFWTPEGWTWSGTKPEHIAATTNDIFAAIAAHKKVQPPFALATCGWVLGPQQDRAMFDKVLPKEVAVSCINREVGRTPVDKGFAEVTGRGKWAIPWLEDDPALTSPQLWVGRMRRDAADARRYGCDGLMGIHWRTRVLGPAVSALAQAAWTQDGWNITPNQPVEPPRVAGPVGGSAAHFPNNAIADTEEDPLYQHVRYNLSAYRLPAPNGSYTVTLKFCEPHYAEAGRRVFGVKLQGKPVIEHLDIFAKVGKDRALDYTFKDVTVANGWLDIEFVPETEFPSIAAFAVEGTGFAKKINCGGEAYKDYAADWTTSAAPKEIFPPTLDFYRDWALAHFGPEVAEPAAQLFAKIDGRLPRPSDWIDGPGGIRPDSRPWEKVREEYAFVEQFADLSSRIKGPGHRERFDYWLNTFHYMRAMGELNCAWARFTNALGRVKAQTDAARTKEFAQATALPLRQQIVKLTGEVYRHLLALVSNPGELGTVANWEQHLLPGLLLGGQTLTNVLGEALPPDAQPTKAYRGLTRVIVPTVRTSMSRGETLSLKVILLSEQPVQDAALYWRPLGKGRFTEARLLPVQRGVHTVKFPPAGQNPDDLEYYVKAVPAKGSPVFFPASAPALNQTVVVTGTPKGTD